MALSSSVILGSLLLLTSSFTPTTTASLISSPGQKTVIPAWKVQSSSATGNDAAKLSSPLLDTSTWYTIGSKATLMGTLLENGVYNDSALFFSDTLDSVEYAPFRVPWFYRAELDVDIKTDNASANGSGDRLQLVTHGISSRADVYLNGAVVADKNTQVGAYGGLTYDITPYVKSGKNVLLIRAYPTDYNRDFALGFVDWNPYPPDNGTGVWRDVEVKKTGPASLLSPPRVNAKLDGRVSIKVDVKSWVDEGVDAKVVCTVKDPQGKEAGKPKAAVKIAGKGWRKVILDIKVSNPRIWWPKQWGEQPLYSTSCLLSTPSGLSDTTSSTRFGIRTVSSSLNTHNDTTFTINNTPFQVLGAGYTSDIFLRFSPSKLRAQFQLVLDMGLNTVRLEGKQEHTQLYELADEMGIMVMAGWECCDKWEGWSYNDEGSGITFTEPDYSVVNTSMRHEAQMMQHHPSLLAFLVGSDFWPDDKATRIYVDALNALDWDVPIIASASQRGYPALLGNGGMKMDGPYDWVPPNYWYNKQLGAAFGFASELGAGVGTPELISLRHFLSPADLADLWKAPEKGLYHMSTAVSSFYSRAIYSSALFARYGAPDSLDDYILKAQMSDYEATRAQFEAYATRWTGIERPATGLVYWMLNNAWPSLHWNLFDYYLHTAGSFFGVKTATRIEHVVYDYATRAIHLVNRSRASKGRRNVDIELVDVKGVVLSKSTISVTTSPNTSRNLDTVVNATSTTDVSFLRLLLSTTDGKVVSRNVYWLSPTPDILVWENSTWYHTPVSTFADYTSLNTMEKTELVVTSTHTSGNKGELVLVNEGIVPAVFVRLGLVDADGSDVVPVFWEDNYVTLFPGERIGVGVRFEGAGGLGGGKRVEVSGMNVDARVVSLS
ncbi:glycoside hydrolase [Massarina eburnea CBS 473.64]|uniref:Glycoside hydrolase n=1 Tax=Massarina eburnea CBS 473.64 TaxID=1395130 RepID=A0A6A6SIN8_9PLEO|nr:glycoside hydrolase [Massarina eburnea CBS 473.64]